MSLGILLTRYHNCTVSTEWFWLFGWLIHNRALCTRIVLLWISTSTGTVSLLIPRSFQGPKRKYNFSHEHLNQYGKSGVNPSVCEYGILHLLIRYDIFTWLLTVCTVSINIVSFIHGLFTRLYWTRCDMYTALLNMKLVFTFLLRCTICQKEQ